MDDGDIFSLLFKWARSTKESDTKAETENYCTQILAIVLSRLLHEADEDHRSQVVRIINNLLAPQFGFRFDRSDKIVIKPWEKRGRFVPDLTIRTEDYDKLVIIEIKVDSPMNGEARKRLRNYKESLSRETTPNKGLMLITKSGREDTTDIIQPGQQPSWFSVSGDLQRTLEVLRKGGRTESAGIYLLENFYEFLKERGMAILKVGDKFDQDTIRNVPRLLAMLQYVCGDKELGFSNGRPWFKVEPRPGKGDSWLGYENRSNGEYAIGIYDEKHVRCYFEIREYGEIERLLADREDGAIISDIHPNAELWKDVSVVGVALDLRGGFAGEGVTEQDQITIMKDFIKTIIVNWKHFKRSAGRSRKRH